MSINVHFELHFHDVMLKNRSLMSIDFILFSLKEKEKENPI